jgi:hypothetical protein
VRTLTALSFILVATTLGWAATLVFDHDALIVALFTAVVILFADPMRTCKLPVYPESFSLSG